VAAAAVEIAGRASFVPIARAAPDVSARGQRSAR
jgi:hypothetical protein